MSAERQWQKNFTQGPRTTHDKAPIKPAKITIGDHHQYGMALGPGANALLIPSPTATPLWGGDVDLSGADCLFFIFYEVLFTFRSVAVLKVFLVTYCACARYVVPQTGI